MTSATWLTFLLVALLTAFSPGPAIALAVAKALGSGPRVAALSSGGNVAGVMAAGAISVAVLDGLTAASAPMQALRAVGGLYLVMLGSRSMLASPSRGMASEPRLPAASGRLATFAGGAGVALLNPKSYLFFGVMTSGLATGRPSAADGALQVAAFAACTALSHATYIVACARAPLSGRMATVLSKACGAATTVLGLAFLFFAWSAIAA